MSILIRGQAARAVRRIRAHQHQFQLRQSLQAGRPQAEGRPPFLRQPELPEIQARGRRAQAQDFSGISGGHPADRGRHCAAAAGYPAAPFREHGGMGTRRRRPAQCFGGL